MFWNIKLGKVVTYIFLQTVYYWLIFHKRKLIELGKRLSVRTGNWLLLLNFFPNEMNYFTSHLCFVSLVLFCFFIRFETKKRKGLLSITKCNSGQKGIANIFYGRKCPLFVKTKVRSGPNKIWLFSSCAIRMIKGLCWLLKNWVNFAFWGTSKSNEGTTKRFKKF